MSDKLPSVGETVELLRGCIGSVDYPPDALLAAAISHLESQRWIPVTERMPEAWEQVLTAYYDGEKEGVCENYRDARKDRPVWYHFADCVTHWRPLPPPPVKEGGEG